MARKTFNVASAALIAALAAAPMAAYAQTSPTVPAATDSRDMMDADADRDGDSEFPWGIIGLVGLAGLLGLNRCDRDAAHICE